MRPHYLSLIFASSCFILLLSPSSVFAQSGDDFNIIFGSGLIIGTNIDDYIKANNGGGNENFGGGAEGGGGVIAENQIFGKDGNDVIKGGPKFDLIYGGDGNDQIQGDSQTASQGDDEIFGEDGDDTVSGEAGDDILHGGNGDDYLIGDGGDDMLSAGPGNDHLYGNLQDDILIGGPGSDYFNCGEGIDVVVDYNPKENDIVTIDCEMGVTSNKIPDSPGNN